MRIVRAGPEGGGAGMNETTATAPDIHCHHCANAIRNEVLEIAGVHEVDVDVPGRRVSVRYEPPATWDIIASHLAEIGYPVAPGSEAPK